MTRHYEMRAPGVVFRPDYWLVRVLIRFTPPAMRLKNHKLKLNRLRQERNCARAVAIEVMERLELMLRFPAFCKFNTKAQYKDAWPILISTYSLGRANANRAAADIAGLLLCLKQPTAFDFTVEKFDPAGDALGRSLTISTPTTRPYGLG